MGRAQDNRRNARMAFVLAAVAVAGVALAFASVPLYRLFCQITGFGGTTQVATAVPQAAVARTMTIRFNADVDPALPWSFQPVEREVRVRVGEPAIAFYRATNRGAESIVGTATFNVTPHKAGAYFSKVECFCFAEQRLGPGESAELPVSFFIDPEIVNDRKLDDVNTITLSYTFFRAENQGNAARTALRASR